MEGRMRPQGAMCVSDVDKVIAENIIRHRERLGITQAELARRVGVKRPTVTQWEAGKGPGKEIIPRIADALGITIDELYRRPTEYRAGEVIALNRGKLPPNLPPEALRELEEHIEYLEWKYGRGRRSKADQEG